MPWAIDRIDLPAVTRTTISARTEYRLPTVLLAIDWNLLGSARLLRHHRQLSHELVAMAVEGGRNRDNRGDDHDQCRFVDSSG